MGFYMQDYGGPIGNRLIKKHPEWLAWQVIQNANTYDEGFLEFDTVKAIYTTGHPDPAKISPDNWNMDLFFLARPQAHRVQLDLL
ncbi:MAG TPA: hypothetical protein VGG75_19025 [Trebonia sp.]